MPISRSICFVLLLSGCASAQEGQRLEHAATKQPLKGGVVQFQTTSYDGQVLLGRVLLGATQDTLVIDGNLYEWVDLELENIHDCAKKTRVKHWVYEALPPPPTPEQIVSLRAGYWYGENAHFVLFDQEKTGIGPDCIETELVVRTLDRRVAARISFQVTRTDKPLNRADDQTIHPKPPPTDANTSSTEKP